MTKHFKQTFFCLIFLSGFLMWGNAMAADYYIAQTAGGNNDATSCANAKVYSWNWTNPNVVAGDTVHLCGTFTSALVIPQSFSAPGVTVKFESGAKFSTSYWGLNGAITITNKNYITIDGDDVGVIEATANGTGLANQQDGKGIYINGGSNITVKNLTIKDLYVRTPDSSDPNKYQKAIQAANTDSVTLDDLIIEDAYYAINAYASTANKSVLNISNNDISRVSTGIIAALDGNVNYSDISIHDNKLYDFYVWDGCWGSCTLQSEWHHNDGIHIWGDFSGNAVGPIYIYNNEIGGDFGLHTTGWIFTEHYVSEIYIHNNLLYTSAEPPTDSFLILASSYTGATAKIYNNTIKGAGTTSGGGNAAYLGSAFSADLQNNIFTNCYTGIYKPNGAAPTTDYNLFYNLGYIGWMSSGATTLASWRTQLGGCSDTGNDCSSITDEPTFVSISDFSLQSNSPAINAGTDLSEYFTTDILGNPRSGVWDIGAYEYTGADDIVAPASPTGLSVS